MGSGLVMKHGYVSLQDLAPCSLGLSKTAGEIKGVRVIFSR